MPDIQATSTPGKIAAGTVQGLVVLGYQSANASLTFFTFGAWGGARIGLGYLAAKDKTAFWGGLVVSQIPFVGLAKEGHDLAMAAGDGDVQGAAKMAVPFAAAVLGTVLVGRSLGSTPKAGPVRPYEVGRFDALQARSVVGDNLALHHAGQAHAMQQVVPGYLRANGPSIALPVAEHRAIPNLQGVVSLGPRQLLARDIVNLRRYTSAPNSALRQLIQLNKGMYPKAFVR